MFNLLLAVLCMVLSRGLSAQDFSGLSVRPKNDPGPQMNVDLDLPKENAGPVSVALPTEWARFAGGLWLGYLGQGVFGTFPRLSSDQAFVDASEKGFGFGLQVDMGVRHTLSQALRFRLGRSSLKISPDDETLESFEENQLEASAKYLNFQIMYRWLWSDYGDIGQLWGGAATTLNFIYSTKPFGSVLTTESNLRSSLGVGYQLVLGWDYPIYKYTDLGFEVGFHPFRSFSGVLSVRTSL